MHLIPKSSLFDSCEQKSLGALEKVILFTVDDA